MIHLQRVLAPVDFSECSKRAQEYACALVDQFQAQLHLLHVLHDLAPLMLDGGTMYALPANYFDEQKQSAEQALTALPSEEWSRGKSVIRELRMGNPFVEIVRYAQERDIDIIVIGTHGRSAISHLLLGSVAEKVVRSAPCPVLIVHPSGHQFVAP
jgi:nucleotide-binding universal stress UspA family protein